MQDGSWSRSDSLPINQSIHPPSPFSSNHLNPTPESSRHGTCLLSLSGRLCRMAAASCAHTETTPHPESARVRNGMTRRSSPLAIAFPNLQIWVLVPILPRGGECGRRGVGGNRAYEIISRKPGAHWHWGRGASLDSMRRPRLSTLSSTMTPRLHENPLAVLHCNTRALALVSGVDDHAWFCSHPAPRVWEAAAPHHARNVVVGGASPRLLYCTCLMATCLKLVLWQGVRGEDEIGCSTQQSRVGRLKFIPSANSSFRPSQQRKVPFRSAVEVRSSKRGPRRFPGPRQQAPCC